MGLVIDYILEGQKDERIALLKRADTLLDHMSAHDVSRFSVRLKGYAEPSSREEDQFWTVDTDADVKAYTESGVPNPFVFKVSDGLFVGFEQPLGVPRPLHVSDVHQFLIYMTSEHEGVKPDFSGTLEGEKS